MMREIFIRDLGWKVFSLLLAVFIWLTVHKIIEEPKNADASASSSPVTYGNLPVYVVATAADVHRYRVTPNTVSVTVRGAAAAIAVLQANQLRATVDLTDIEAAKDLKRQVEVSAPSGITLVHVEPQKVGVIIPPPVK
jgi:YbbR domain-containing protein